MFRALIARAGLYLRSFLSCLKYCGHMLPAFMGRFVDFLSCQTSYQPEQLLVLFVVETTSLLFWTATKSVKRVVHKLNMAESLVEKPNRSNLQALLGKWKLKSGLTHLNGNQHLHATSILLDMCLPLTALLWILEEGR